jgi:hypothetical protein
MADHDVSPDTQLTDDTLTNYQGNLRDESASKEAAVAADFDASGGQAAQSPGQSDYGLLSVKGEEIDSDYAMGRAAYFRDKIDQYYAKAGRDGNAGGHRSMTYHRDGFIRDVNFLQKANLAFNMFTPASDLFARSIVRIDTMQEIIPDVAADDADFSTELKGHEKGFKLGVKQANLQQTVGRVAKARRDFGEAREDVKTTALDFTEIVNGEVLQVLMGKVKEKGDKKDEIEAKIARIKTFCKAVSTGLSVLGKAAGAASGYLPAISTTEDFASESKGLGAAEKVGDHADLVETAGDVIADLAYGKELAILEGQISAMQGEMSQWDELTKADRTEGIVARFRNAKKVYLDRYKDYVNAIASQRSAYAETGADADASEAKKKVKGAAKDPVAQVMVYMSAIREAYQAMQDAKDAYHGQSGAGGVRQRFAEAEASMRAHTGDGVEFWNQQYLAWREGGPTGPRFRMELNERPDFTQIYYIGISLDYFDKYTKEEEQRLSKLEMSATKALSDKGSTAGEY